MHSVERICVSTSKVVVYGVARAHYRSFDTSDGDIVHVEVGVLWSPATPDVA
jgi:hypothetical protein